MGSRGRRPGEVMHDGKDDAEAGARCPGAPWEGDRRRPHRRDRAGGRSGEARRRGVSTACNRAAAATVCHAGPPVALPGPPVLERAVGQVSGRTWRRAGPVAVRAMRRGRGMTLRATQTSYRKPCPRRKAGSAVASRFIARSALSGPPLGPGGVRCPADGRPPKSVCRAGGVA